MPRKLFTKKKGTRRPKKIRSKATAGKSLSFPTNKIVQLRYATEVQLVDSVGGVLDLHAFRANGIYDPDVTGTGHQPLGRDQWFQFYNHYKVISSKISVVFNPIAIDSAAVPVVIGAYLADDISVPTAWSTLVESGRGAYATVPMLGSDQIKRTMSTRFSSNTFFKGQGINQSQLGAAENNDPTEQAYYIIWCQSGDQGSTFDPLRAMVVIDYLVEFSEPKDLVAS